MKQNAILFKTIGSDVTVNQASTKQRMSEYQQQLIIYKSNRQ